MSRSLKFADFTIGHVWTSDYGDPHDPHDFDFIYPISPVHNIPTNKILPPMLLLTAGSCVTPNFMGLLSRYSDQW